VSVGFPRRSHGAVVPSHRCGFVQQGATCNRVCEYGVYFCFDGVWGVGGLSSVVPVVCFFIHVVPQNDLEGTEKYAKQAMEQAGSQARTLRLILYVALRRHDTRGALEVLRRFRPSPR
jgi:hypothetical protein